MRCLGVTVNSRDEEGEQANKDKSGGSRMWKGRSEADFYGLERSRLSKKRKPAAQDRLPSIKRGCDGDGLVDPPDPEAGVFKDGTRLTQIRTELMLKLFSERNANAQLSRHHREMRARKLKQRNGAFSVERSPAESGLDARDRLTWMVEPKEPGAACLNKLNWKTQSSSKLSKQPSLKQIVANRAPAQRWQSVIRSRYDMLCAAATVIDEQAGDLQAIVVRLKQQQEPPVRSLVRGSRHSAARSQRLS